MRRDQYMEYMSEVVVNLKILRTNIVMFFHQIRTEITKVVWPTRHETIVSTIMVLVVVFLVSMFFHLADWFMSFSISSGVNFFISLFRLIAFGEGK